MSKKEISKYIPGIYNYCDRWCERCAFTNRCLNFENTGALSPEENDISNKAFWENLGKRFEDTIKLLDKAAKKYGIDLNAITKEESEEYSRKEKKDRQSAKNHPLAKITWRYADEAGKFLENNELIKEKIAEMASHFSMGLQTRDLLEKETAGIADCYEIINWYLHFIHVKFMRALMGKIEDDGWEEENGYPKDSDGSAKVAIISIERSIEAWASIMQIIPEAEDKIIDILSLLQKSLRLAGAEFPEARKFIRPGFDE